MLGALLPAIFMVSRTTTQRGGVAGGAIGAGTGAVISHQSCHAGGGALIGHEIDKNQQQQPSAYEYESGRYCSGGDYEGEYSAEGRRWAREHEEIRVHTAPAGSRYEKKNFVPGHYG